MEIRTGSRDDLAAILELQKTSKDTVGFLRDQAVRDRLDRGTMLVAEGDDGRIVGYLLYDLPRNEVSIKQLVTDPSTRLGGVAEQLVPRQATFARLTSSRSARSWALRFRQRM